MSSITPRHLTDSRRKLLRTQIEPPISWNTGAVYLDPQYDLSTYQTFIPVAHPRLLLSKAAATQFLVDFLTPLKNLPEDEQSAIIRVYAAWRHADWDSSLVIKAMADLDTAFFHGRLKGYVVVAWAGEKEILEKGIADRKGPKREIPFGICQPLLEDGEGGEQRCKVWLNADAIFDMPDPKVLMWETLLHELVHAYAYISSDRNLVSDDVNPTDPLHDGQFNYLLSMVDRRSMYHLQMPARPVGYGHTMCVNCIWRPLMQGDGRGRRWIRSGIEGLMKVENSLRQAANYVSQLLLGIGIV